MNNKSLLQKSRRLRAQAEKLLKSSGILKTLKKCGRVKVTGSYKLDLMMDGDIDIHVIGPRTKKADAIRALNTFIRQGYFRGYLLGNWDQHTHKKFPRGYYIGLKIKIGQTKWKVDIWFLAKEDLKELRLMGWVSKRLNPKNKAIILKLKQAVKERDLKIPSLIIYKAVLREGTSNFKNLAKYIDR